VNLWTPLSRSVGYAATPQLLLRTIPQRLSHAAAAILAYICRGHRVATAGMVNDVPGRAGACALANVVPGGRHPRLPFSPSLLFETGLYYEHLDVAVSTLFQAAAVV